MPREDKPAAALEPLRITFAGPAVKSVGSWADIIQPLIKAITGRDGLLVRISRRDKFCDYTAPGTYDLDYFMYLHREVLPVVLVVERTGSPPSPPTATAAELERPI